MGLVGDDHWDKLHVVHCGVRPERYEQRSHAAASDGPVRLLTVGRLAPVKGQALLLAAVRELRSEGVDVLLTVIGDGPRRDTLEDASRRLEIDEAVEFAGAISQDEIARYYLGADIYVHPSFAEGVPVVIMEAMAHALPVVAAGVMGVRELVHHGENGLVVRPGRKDELVDAVRRLAADPSERARMGQSGRRTVEAEFDVRGSAQLLRDLFTSHAS
jgi:glycosyltransferase involved in cell wall biosynthesis